MSNFMRRIKGWSISVRIMLICSCFLVVLPLISNLPTASAGSAWIHTSDKDFNNKVWQLFFPEAVGVMENKHQYANALRKSRIVDIDEENPK